MTPVAELKVMGIIRTTEEVKLGDTSPLKPEFGRASDVQRLFGIKRGTLYNLLADGKVRGCLLRVRGQKSGVRLIDLDSVRNHILDAMTEAQSAGQTQESDRARQWSGPM